jgi:hypothetical protein
MPTCTEADQLARIIQVRPARIVFSFQPPHVYQHLFRSGMPRQR